MACVAYQSNFFRMLEELYLCFPFESSAVISNFFNVHQFGWSVHASIARPSSGVVLFEPAEGIGGPAGIVTAIATQDHIAIIFHKSSSAADQEVHDRHQRAANDDAEEIKTKPRSDKDQC